MKTYAGFDVPKQFTHVVVMAADGGVLKRGKLKSEPSALIAFVRRHGGDPELAGLETGPFAVWRQPFGWRLCRIDAPPRPAGRVSCRERIDRLVAIDRYQSGKKDSQGWISRAGDRYMRGLLFEAAQVLMFRCADKAKYLQSWALSLAERIGRKKALVALARRLAVIMHVVLVKKTDFRDLEPC